MRRRALANASAFALVVPLMATTSCKREPSPPEPSTEDSVAEGDAGEPPADALARIEADYLGEGACKSCHADQVDAHRGSDHDRAMEVPSPQTVAAPFDGQTIEIDGVKATLEHEGDDYVVRTEGPDGKAHDYVVRWTFGHAPLQQYLLDLGDGRLQAWTIAWDARTAEDGGQRFYSLYPGERFAPTDELHWTGAMQNWNYVCADCHSTHYAKDYDASSGRFSPTWTSPDVDCEACHGPGSSHVAWAKSGEDPADTRKGLVVNLANAKTWTMDPKTHNATPQPEIRHTEVDTCAPCHARRHQIAEGRRPDDPLFDFYRPALLDADLYHPDGQIDGEVYVYGSFVQSKMFGAGVRCSDCHDPHDQSLKADGDALCGRCHDATVYAAPTHHHHANDTQAVQCVDCHMPGKLYMGVDFRRDHSLRVPRPDISVTTGTPNACNLCHAEKDTGWAAEAASRWWPRLSDRPSHAQLIKDARRGSPDARVDLAKLAIDPSVPGIVRGTALSFLGDPTGAHAEAIERGLADDAPIVRLGALHATQNLPPPLRTRLVAPLLSDPRRVIRTEAARVLADVPATALPKSRIEAHGKALLELRQTEELHADRADAWLRIGNLELAQRDPEAAKVSLQRAIQVDPNTVVARVNLADLQRALGDEAASETLLLEASELAPQNAEVLHALGLLEIRTERKAQALVHLRDAAKLRPEQARYAYVYAIALWDAQRKDEALDVLDAAIERHPFDRSLIQTRDDFAKSR